MLSHVIMSHVMMLGCSMETCSPHLLSDNILTTHYIELCELLEKRNAGAITNLHMSVCADTGAYLYKIASGISSIKGGLKVLRDLDYPNEIVESARDIIQG